MNCGTGVRGLPFTSNVSLIISIHPTCGAEELELELLELEELELLEEELLEAGQMRVVVKLL
jgi:hypothetical protein